MNAYELLTLLIAVVAAIISVVSLVRTRQMQEEQIRLAKVTAELSKKQLERMGQEDEVRQKASIRVTLEKEGGDYRFWIRNEGHAKATDVWMTLDCEGPDNPIVGSEYKDKIPIRFLSPGDKVSLLAAITLSSSGKYTVRTRWINEDDTQSEREFFLSI